MIGDLKAENTILKEANEKLVNRSGQYPPGIKYRTYCLPVLFVLCSKVIQLFVRSQTSFVLLQCFWRGEGKTAQGEVSTNGGMHRFTHSTKRASPFRYISLPSSAFVQPKIFSLNSLYTTRRRIFLSLSKLGCDVNDSLFHARCSDFRGRRKEMWRGKTARGGLGRVWQLLPSLSFSLFFFPALCLLAALHYLSAWKRRIIIRFWETAHLPLP